MLNENRLFVTNGCSKNYIFRQIVVLLLKISLAHDVDVSVDDDVNVDVGVIDVVNIGDEKRRFEAKNALK